MKTVAWFSRHEPTPAMRHDLRGFQIVQVNPPGRAISPRDAYRCIASRAGWVDVVVYIGPETWTKEMLFIFRRYQPDAIFIAPIMASHSKDVWSGKWRKIFWSERQQRVIWGVRWNWSERQRILRGA